LNRLKIRKTQKQVKQEQRQARIKAITEKKATGKLSLEDIDEKLDIILEMLQDRRPLE
jgi:hypothetical protein